MSASMEVHPQSNLQSASNLTNAQMMVWIGQALHPGVPLYNMPLAISIRGALSEQRFAEALESVVARSDAMRSVFKLIDGIPQRQVMTSMRSDHTHEDWSGDQIDLNELRRRLESRSQRSFDLTEQLFDSALFKIADDHHVWFINQHHLITDGWAAGNLLKNVWNAYQERHDGNIVDAPLCAFEDYAVAEQYLRNTSEHQNAVAYWKSEAIQNAKLPSLYVGSGIQSDTRATRTAHLLGTERSRRLHEVSSKSEFRALTPSLTLFSLFSTTLFALLHRLTSQSNLLIGVPSNNRGSRSLKETIGLFVELYPFSVSVDDADSFASLHRKVLQKATTNLLKTRPGACTPEIQRTFNVVLNYINTSLPGMKGLETETQWLHTGHSDPGHHLRLEIHDLNETGDFHFLFDTNDDVFGPTEREQLIRHFDLTMDALLADPDGLIANIDLATSRTQTAPTWTSKGESIVDRFKTVVREYQDTPAVSAPSKSITYQQLDEASDQIARMLQDQRSIQHEDVVGIVADRSISMISGILGILKAGAAYVPVEPSHPKVRVDHLLRDSNARLVLDPSGSYRAATPIPMISLAALSHHEFRTRPLANVTSNTCAYITYTSGSTGTPNGVAVEHDSVVSLVDALHERVYRRFENPLNVALVAPLIFDASVQQIFASLLYGHCLCLVPEEARMNAVLLRKFYEDFDVDISDGTPSHLQLLSDFVDTNDLKLPSHFIIGGEKLTSKHCRNFFDAVSPNQPVITNVYGVAECSVDSTSCDVTIENLDAFSDEIPIGKSLENSSVAIVNPQLRRQPAQVVGEIAIGGAGVARGYVKRVELTQSKFIDHPENDGERLYLTGDLGWRDVHGNIHFVGRRDNQVKINGIRVELGEIEKCMLEFNQVANQELDCIEAPDAKVSVRCSSCLLTSHHPGIEFDSSGVCHVCRKWTKYQAAAELYFQSSAKLAELLNAAKAMLVREGVWSDE